MIKKNIKIIIAFILGMIVSGSGVYAATVASSDVSYTNNSQSTVQGALNDLYSDSKTAKEATTLFMNGLWQAYKAGASAEGAIKNGYCKAECCKSTQSGCTQCTSTCSGGNTWNNTTNLYNSIWD